MTDAVFLYADDDLVFSALFALHLQIWWVVGVFCFLVFFLSLFDFLTPSSPSLVTAELCWDGWGERWCAGYRAKKEWRQSEAIARWGGGDKKKLLGYKNEAATRSAFSVAAGLGLCVFQCVCVCVCVCACVHMRQSYKGFGLLQWSLGVNLWALTLFPFSAIALSTYSKSLAFCSLLSELSLLAAAAAAAAAQAPFSQSAALMSFISMAGSEDGPLKTFSSRGDRAATMGQRPSMLSQ